MDRHAAPASPGRGIRVHRRDDPLPRDVAWSSCLLPAWTATATDPEALPAALDGVDVALAVHLPDGGDAWMRTNLPAPVNLLWRWAGRPRHERNRAAPEGGRPAG